MYFVSKIARFLKCLVKKNKEESSDTVMVNIGLEYSYLKDIAQILKIIIPEIAFVQCLYDDGEHIVGHIKIVEDEIPEYANFQGANYLDDRNCIVMSLKRAVFDHEKSIIHFVDQSPAEYLFNFAHELRHVWQKEYHEDMYYKKNSVGMEAIYDIAEIDADAFALAYIFSNRTPYTASDMSNQKLEIGLQGTLDNGARWKLAEELSYKYGFEGREKINQAHIECNSSEKNMEKLFREAHLSMNRGSLL